jgi:hypothetical protein
MLIIVSKFCCLFYSLRETVYFTQVIFVCVCVCARARARACACASTTSIIVYSFQNDLVGRLFAVAA